MAWEAALRERFGSIHPTTVLEYPLEVSNPRRIQVGSGTRISWGCKLLARTECRDRKMYPEILIGDDCYLGNYVHLAATQRIAIGRGVLLADGIHLSDTLHDYTNGGCPIMQNERTHSGELHIGDDSWIGENVTIAGDIRIGRHCVVGANAVVDRNLPDFSVAVGMPARVIKRYNFSSEQWEATNPDGSFMGAASGINIAPADSEEVGLGRRLSS